MDNVDRALERAEEDAASPGAYRRASHEIERVPTASSASSASSAGSDTPYRRRRNRAASQVSGVSRVSTQADLERHPTELSRIATARSQHSGTVGRDLRSRESRKPLPAFGAGKPYPPMLPAQEEYVVEFEGPDDPMHSQNWPIRKK